MLFVLDMCLSSRIIGSSVGVVLTSTPQSVLLGAKAKKLHRARGGIICTITATRVAQISGAKREGHQPPIPSTMTMKQYFASPGTVFLQQHLVESAPQNMVS